MYTQFRGEVLQAARRNKGYTQAQLADKLGIPKRSISLYETSFYPPHALTLVNLCRHLGVQAESLFV